METATTNTAFLEALASADPAPGGGGAAAYAGALGTALASMVANLTTGKQKYAAVQDDIERILERAQELYAEQYALIARDAEDFLPLAAAYRLPSETEEEKAHKNAVMEEALAKACETPLAIMHCAMESLRLHEELAEKGSILAVSDVGAGAALLGGSLQAASLNIFINAKSMQDRAKAEALLQETEEMLREGTALAEKIFADVKEKLA